MRVSEYVTLYQLQDICRVSRVELALARLVEQELQQFSHYVDLGLSLGKIFEGEVADEGLEDLEELR